MKNKNQLKTRTITLVPTDAEKPWDEPWLIHKNYDDEDPGKVIGYISLAGERAKGVVPLTIEIYDKCDRNRGYGTTAIRLMVEWAFCHKSVFEITAVSEHENSSYIMALQKAGFVMRESTRTIENYSIVKQKTSWTGLYMFIGIVVGMIVGFVFDNAYGGVAVGVLLCTIIGSSMDHKEKVYRESITGKKE